MTENEMDAFLFVGPVAFIAGICTFGSVFGQGLVFWGLLLSMAWALDKFFEKKAVK